MEAVKLPVLLLSNILNLTLSVKRIFVFILLIHAVSGLKAQSLYYDIIKGDKIAGYMTVKKVVSGDKIDYSIESRTAVRVVFMVKVNYDLFENFENGVLIGGKSKSTLNGATQKSTIIKKYDDRYEFELESDRVTLHQKEITYSIPEIYFSKPKGHVKVFSQVFAQYLDYEKINENTWVLISEDGKNVSTYNDDGILEMVNISRVYANFNLVLNKEKSEF
ncbi:DUF6134 family protein [Reichenbachiella versicolor]|uniref:DUF6134 family protein n=1 Tax=Reichenbachiella versicolor TaxID=1821036 RepID=UPI000D6DF6CC|nr:DUF6134 family protein [Reichenbachiella versicolor]